MNSEPTPTIPTTSNVFLLWGRVRSLYPSYGFIVDQTGLSRFFHCSDVVGGREKFNELYLLDQVEFTPCEGARSPRAAGVVKLSKIIENKE